MRLIDADRLLAAIKVLKKSVCYQENNCQMAINEIEGFIYSSHVFESPEWHPIIEGKPTYPDRIGSYLVTVEKNGTRDTAEAYFYDNGFAVYDEPNDEYAYKIFKVLAWAELPRPYKGDL